MTSQCGKQTIAISVEVKAIRRWNLVGYCNIIWETFFLKNHTQNVVD